MKIKNTDTSYIAGFAVCTALLANDLLFFGNLNLNTISIVGLVIIALACSVKLLVNINQRQTK